MSFDLSQVNAAIAEYGVVYRIVIAAIRGSSPREVGASMLVWQGGQSGTIGGGALEYQAAANRVVGISQHALGPSLGQCCGGHVTLVTERFTQALPTDTTFVRRVDGAHDMPLSMSRMIRDTRNGSTPPTPLLENGWFLEPITQPTRPLWIWGAGHVGRAMVEVMSGVPEFEITWIDTAPERFPGQIPHGVTILPTQKPDVMMQYAPQSAEHLIFTYSHALDLALCHAALTHGFSTCGLIGSRTKWSRFYKRLGELGHMTSDIEKIACPIGDPSLGKHPKAIAIGVASRLMSNTCTQRFVRSG